MPPPEHLLGSDLLPGAGELLAAFYELETDRPIGMGIARIPGAAIRDYARFHEITDPDEFELLTRIVRACDDVVMTRAAKETKHG